MQDCSTESKKKNKDRVCPSPWEWTGVERNSQSENQQKIFMISFYKQFFNLDVTHVHNIPGLSDWVVSG